MEINFQSLKSFDGRVTEDEFNAVVDTMRSLALCAGANYSIKRNTLGTTITPRGTASAATTVCPFDITVTTPDPADPTSKALTLRPGTVNNLLPDNIFDTFYFDSSSVIKVIATAVSDGTRITSCTMSVDSSDPVIQTPTPFGLPTNVDTLVAVIVNGVATRLISCGSITLVGQQQYVTDKTPPVTPGTLNYIPYYVWKVA